MSFSLINSINGLGKEDFISNEDPNLAVGKPWFVCLPSSVSRTGEAFQTTEPGLWWTCSSLSDIQTPYTPWKRLKSVRHFERQKCARRQAEACTHALCATGHTSVCSKGTWKDAQMLPMQQQSPCPRGYMSSGLPKLTWAAVGEWLQPPFAGLQNARLHQGGKWKGAPEIHSTNDVAMNISTYTSTHSWVTVYLLCWKSSKPHDIFMTFQSCSKPQAQEPREGLKSGSVLSEPLVNSTAHKWAHQPVWLRRQRRAGVIIAQPSLTRIAFPTQSQLCSMLIQTSVLCRTQVSSAPSPRLLNDATRIMSSLTADPASSEELCWSPPCIQMVPCALWLYGASSYPFTDGT